jgi:hypothetical protein
MTDDVDPRRSHGDRIDPHPALRAGLSLPGRGVSLLLRWEQAAAFCPLTRPTCTLAAGNVGATRWVALSVRRVHWDRVGSCGADVHRGARATHRVAPTVRPGWGGIRCSHVDEVRRCDGCVDATIALRGRPRQRRAPAAPACGSSNTCQRGIPNPTATHRVAPTSPAYSRVRCTKEHRGRPVAWVVGAVREPPLQRPAGPWCERGDRGPCAGDRLQGTAAPCLYREWLHNGYKTAAGPLVVSGKPLKNQGRV